MFVHHKMEKGVKVARYVVGGLVLIICCAPICRCSPQPEASPPNIVFVVYDCARYDGFSISGNHMKTSPFFDRLARKSIYFDRAIAPATWTFPSHAAMFTGYRNYQLIRDNSLKHQKIKPSIPMISDHLAKRGYVTISFADHYYFGPVFDSLNRGFEFFDIMFNPVDRPSLSFTNCYDGILQQEHVTIPTDEPGTLEALKKHYRKVLEGNYGDISDLDRTEEKYPDVRILLRKSGYIDLRYGALFQTIEKNKDKPLYIYFNLHNFPSHRTTEAMNAEWFFEYLRLNGLPYRDPYEFGDGSIDNAFLCSDYFISFYDAVCESIFDYFHSNGLENTVFIITSDHGHSHREHGERLFKHAGAIPWEYAIRVPLLVNLPDTNLEETRVTIEKPVSLVDIFYTIMDIAGIDEDSVKPHKEMVGKSLLKRARENSYEEYEVSESPAHFSYSEIATILPDLARRYPSLKPNTLLSGKSYAIYNGDYKLIYIPSCCIGGVREFELTMLFNLKKDPEETTDLSEKLPDVVADFMTFFKHHKKIMKRAQTVAKNTVEIDKETERQLRALGYLN